MAFHLRVIMVCLRSPDLGLPPVLRRDYVLLTGLAIYDMIRQKGVAWAWLLAL